MDTKLTLKLDKGVIEKAKAYATTHNKSLSRMVEAYLKSLTDAQADKPNGDIEISPYVKSLQTGGSLPTDLDHKKAYGEYLADKYS